MSVVTMSWFYLRVPPLRQLLRVLALESDLLPQTLWRRASQTPVRQWIFLDNKISRQSFEQWHTEFHCS
jgi:hypothetical protein